MKVEVWVHCDQHGAPHCLDDNMKSCWCGCIDNAPNVGRHGTILSASSQKEAYEECRERKLWLSCDIKEKSRKEQEE